MEFHEFIAQLLDVNWNMVKKALDGLTPEEIARRPTDESNSIGWLMWHTARDEDYLISVAQQQPQLWVREGWHKKFNMKPSFVEYDFRDMGMGQTAKEVDAFKAPDVKVLIGYYLAVREATKGYLKSITIADLDKEMADPWSEGTTPLATYLYCLVDEALAHGGQVANLRGMYRGMGWFE